MPFFLGTGFLFAGIAIVIPIALHLLHRRKPQPTLFAAVRFLQEAIASSRRSRRITQGVTLLMRILIILLLALAFARPYVRQSGLIPAGHRVVLLVVDSSASMRAQEGGKTYFDLARAWAQVLLDGLQEGDKVALVAPGLAESRVVFPAVSDQKAVRGALQELACGFGPAMLAEDIMDILDKAKDSVANFEMHVFSDFQKTNWSGTSAAKLAEVVKSCGGAIFFNKVGVKSANDSGVAGVQFMPMAVMGDGRFLVETDVIAAESFLGANTVRLVMEDEEVNHVALRLSPGESEKCTMSSAGTAGKTADVVGLLELETDVFDGNNRYYYSLPRLAGLPALLVNGSGDERDSYYLKHALNPGGVSASLMVPVEMSWNEFLSTGDLSDQAIVFICNPPALDDASSRLILNYLQSGGTVILFPGGSGAGQLDAVSVARLDAWPNLKLTYEELPKETRCEILLQDSSDLLGRRMQQALPAPWPLTLRRRLRLSVPGGEGGVFHYQEGGDFLLRKRIGEGNLWLSSISANRDWGDWPMSPMFFIFVQELCRQAAGQRQKALMTEVGSELLLNWPGKDMRATFAVTDSEGGRRLLEVERDAVSKPFVLNGFSKPGIYALACEGTAYSRRVAVNIPASERELAYWNGDALKGTLPGVPVSYSEDNEQLRREMLGLRQSRPLWPWLLLLAFVLSMVEVVFANLRSRPVGQPHLVGRLLKHGGDIA